MSARLRKIAYVREVFTRVVDMGLPHAAIGMIDDDSRLLKPTRKWSYNGLLYNVVDYVVSQLAGEETSCADDERTDTHAYSERGVYEDILAYLISNHHKTMADHRISVDREINDEDVASISRLSAIENLLSMRFIFCDGDSNQEYVRDAVVKMTPEVARFVLDRLEGSSNTRAILEMVAATIPDDAI